VVKIEVRKPPVLTTSCILPCVSSAGLVVGSASSV
jgi:hypothetical protein